MRRKPISLATGHVEGLDPGQWLSTSLVDYVLQTSLAARPPPVLSVLQDPDYIMQMAEFRRCPVQTNGYDCGLFALAVVWHLLCDKDIHPSVFTQFPPTQDLQ
ncbi:hypothetical protein IV203_032777 [Nitzschia inconspicua]|uniref:Uncharacterized protein n=1 Tax=Nitzschia inconspicua TaxID=303405 RepID=A0A9K3KKY4_9STRA|nr:hypothetical protein IV203_032777 [Nitzschia inconspicua]